MLRWQRLSRATVAAGPGEAAASCIARQSRVCQRRVPVPPACATLLDLLQAHPLRAGPEPAPGRACQMPAWQRWRAGRRLWLDPVWCWRGVPSGTGRLPLGGQRRPVLRALHVHRVPRRCPRRWPRRPSAGTSECPAGAHPNGKRLPPMPAALRWAPLGSSAHAAAPPGQRAGRGVVLWLREEGRGSHPWRHASVSMAKAAGWPGRLPFACGLRLRQPAAPAIAAAEGCSDHCAAGSSSMQATGWSRCWTRAAAAPDPGADT